MLVALGVIAASFFAARALTVNSLTSQNSIFDTFEQVDGAWLFSDKIGAAAASGVERARVAIGGPLGLSSKEAVYFCCHPGRWRRAAAISMHLSRLGPAD